MDKNIKWIFMVKQILSCCKMLMIPLSSSALLCHALIPLLIGVWAARLTDVSSSLKICSYGITPARVTLLRSLPHWQSGHIIWDYIIHISFSFPILLSSLSYMRKYCFGKLIPWVPESTSATRVPNFWPHSSPDDLGSKFR